MKNKSFILSILLSFLISISSCKKQSDQNSSIKSNDKLEERIEKILSKLSLEEKIGQMTQLSLDVVLKKEQQIIPGQDLLLDSARLDTVFKKYKVGSLLNCPHSTPLNRFDWHRLITRLQKKALSETGIPLIYGLDMIHGASYTVDATLFPQQITMAATFNPSLVYDMATISAYETRASGVAWTFSPILGLGRNPCWSRQWETFGEDAYLATEMGKQCVLGYQGNNPNKIDHLHVAACLKHYIGYSNPRSGKDRTPSYIPLYLLREKYFLPFKEAINNGALSVMVNSSSNNGLSVHADYELLTTWLKDDLKWDGLIVTDWADIANLYRRDHICSNFKEAIALAINAGIDMAMVPYDWNFCNYLKQLVEEGKVKMSRIDDAVRRVLRLKLRLNLFEKPTWDINSYKYFATAKSKKIALKAAEEGITLLKNKNNILPLSKKTRILVTGPNANSLRCLNGGWSMSWQGDIMDKYYEECNTITEAFQKELGMQYARFYRYVPTLEYAPGHYSNLNEKNVSLALTAAKESDVIILCLGENSYCETVGNLNELTLAEKQLNLVKMFSELNKPIILVLNEGRPRIIREIEPLVDGIVQMYLPGNYGGDALVNILYGKVNPSGRLPYTYPKYCNSLITYDYKPSEKTGTMSGSYNYNAKAPVQWPFGFGLSYTSFKYSNLKIDKQQFLPSDTINLQIDVENTGKIAGKETVLLFSTDQVASMIPDNKRLRSFKKVQLDPMEKKTVSFKLPATDLAYVDRAGNWILEEGDFNIQIGTEKKVITMSDERP